MPGWLRVGVVRAALAALVLACSSSSSTPPPAGSSGWWRDRVAYEVYVRSFADSNGDGKGDLAGLTAKLDYLNDGNPASTTSLHVGAVWLMPIYPSPSVHGYDVTDYQSVNPDYGTLQDFDTFVSEAHRRGIQVILDMVLNHTSTQHPWFVSSRDPASPKRSWYDWSATIPWTQNTGYWRNGGTGYYYAYFDGSMPDLNLGNPDVEATLVAAMKFWLARGVDGFRLDGVRYYFEAADGSSLADQPATHAFIKRIRAALVAQYPNALLLGEAWTTEAKVVTYYGNGDELHLAFSFDLADALKRGAAPGGNTSAPVNTLYTNLQLHAADLGFAAPFLSNHDMDRTLLALSGDAAAARVAAAALFAIPGTPFVYYGEEIGMQGGTAAGTDTPRRTPLPWDTSAPGNGFTANTMLWCGTNITGWCGYPEAAGVEVAAEQRDAGSLWNLYRRLIGLRNATPALAAGGATLDVSAPTGVMALVRTDPATGKRVLFVGNFNAAATGAFTVNAAGTPTVLLSEGLATPPALASGKLSFADLAARGFAYVSLE